MGVDRVADLHDRVLEHAVRRRVGDHEGGELVGELLGLLLQVGDVHVAELVAADGDNAHAAHDGGGGVCAVGAGGDDADVPLSVAVGDVVVADGEQAGVLPLRAAVRLKADLVEACGSGLSVSVQGRQRDRFLKADRERITAGKQREIV